MSQKLINISEGYGEGYEVTLRDYQEMNPEGEFKLCWDGSIIQIFSDEPGDWKTVARLEETDGE